MPTCHRFEKQQLLDKKALLHVYGNPWSIRHNQGAMWTYVNSRGQSFRGLGQYYCMQYGMGTALRDTSANCPASCECQLCEAARLSAATNLNYVGPHRNKRLPLPSRSTKSTRPGIGASEYSQETIQTPSTSPLKCPQHPNKRTLVTSVVPTDNKVKTRGVTLRT